MHTQWIWVAFACAAATGCKDLTVPDYNAGSLGSLETSPSRVGIATAAQGLFVGVRQSVNQEVVIMGELGREGYSLDPSNPNLDPYFVTQSPDIGDPTWIFSYADIKQANVILDAVRAVSDMTPAEKEATRGFAQTMQAIDFLRIAMAFDSSGAAISVDRAPLDSLAPIVSRADVYAHIQRLLDSAQQHLAAGGAAFPFGFTSGFSSFATPATFVGLNRALRARVDVYTGNYSAALTSVAASFLDTTAPMALGAYHSYSTNSGDAINPLFEPTARILFAHPSVTTDAEQRVDGTLDLRVQQKVQVLPPTQQLGIPVDSRYVLYSSPTTPVPVIRNEELILLRAEARYFTGDASGALADINLVRDQSGGLPPLAGFASADDFVTALLYERRYSLMWEGGYRWVDMRRFGRLTELPRALPSHKIFQYLAIPPNECLARTPQPAGCAVPAPL